MTPTDTARAVRPVVLLLCANLVLGAVFALLTVLFRDSVLAHQLAADPGRDRAEAEVSLWTRAGMVVVVAFGYLWVLKGLRAGRRGAYRRVRVLSAVGLVAVGVLVGTAAYPSWLRVIQIGQLVLLATLVWLVNSKRVRECFPAQAPTGKPVAALVLAVVTPVIADFSLGTVPLSMAWVMLVYIPIYGGGVVLAREVVRRTGDGAFALLLMGLAYGVLEEGIALRGLTSPTLYGAAGWAPRLFGVNTAYAELNLFHHMVFSVLLPVVLVESLFREHGRRPYLGRAGLVLVGFVTAVGVVLARITAMDLDPGYDLPVPVLVVLLALIVCLVVAAIRVRPTIPPSAPPRPVAVGVWAGAASLLFVALLFPFGGAAHPAFTRGSWVFVPMVVAAVIAVVTLGEALRWAESPLWTVKHVWAAVGAAVAGQAVFGAIAEADAVVDRAALLVLAAAVLGVTSWSVRRVRVERAVAVR